MEALSQTLQPYKTIIGNIASVVTIGQFFSGGFICKDIYNKGSTDGISSVPFTGGITIGVLMLKYAAMLEDPAMFQVNAAAILLNAIYLIIYILYTESKSSLIKPITACVTLTAIIFGYAQYEKPDLIEYRYGLIVTVLMLSLIGSPLLEVTELIKNKDASSLPFPMIFSGTIVSFLWFIYGIILLNYFMIVQNLIGLGLCTVQLILCFAYPGDKLKDYKKKKE